MTKNFSSKLTACCLYFDTLKDKNINNKKKSTTKLQSETCLGYITIVEECIDKNLRLLTDDPQTFILIVSKQ